MKPNTRIIVILTGLLLVWCLALSAQEDQNSAPKPEPRLTNWYKIDISLNEFEDGKRINTRSYTANAEENGGTSVAKLGDRVPIVTGSAAPGSGQSPMFQYLDVGLNISCYIRDRHGRGRLGLTVAVDQSSVTFADQKVLRTAPDQPVIRQMKMENTAFVTLGKPTLIASVDDPGKPNHKYTVEATVTKLNP